MLNYYQDREINPVPIDLSDKAAWDSHVAKRRNLYERHLGIPLALLRDRSVLEFGCNSGENALVLAEFGANLTLVEPHGMVLPRLKNFFQSFGLEDRILHLLEQEMDTFQTEETYDLVVAEGFLNHLDNCDEMLTKICGLLAPHGMGVVSLDDRFGHFVELTRKVVFWRALRLEGIHDGHSPESLEIAKRLYGQDFGQINASRPFEAWWQDVLLNPFVGWKYLWTYQQLLPLLEDAGCAFYSSSPKWAMGESYDWYKNVSDGPSVHKSMLQQWNEEFPFFLTGLRPDGWNSKPASGSVVQAVSDLILQISDYVSEPDYSVDSIEYPALLDDYLTSLGDPRLVRFNTDMRSVFQALQADSTEDLISAYKNAEYLRTLWGAPCHYICFTRSG